MGDDKLVRVTDEPKALALPSQAGTGVIAETKVFLRSLTGQGKAIMTGSVALGVASLVTSIVGVSWPWLFAALAALLFAYACFGVWRGEYHKRLAAEASHAARLTELEKELGRLKARLDDRAERWSAYLDELILCPGYCHSHRPRRVFWVSTISMMVPYACDVCYHKLMGIVPHCDPNARRAFSEVPLSSPDP